MALPQGKARAGNAPGTVFRSQQTRSRRSPAEVDTLRVEMLSQGYPLPYLTEKENEHVFSSLVQRRRFGRVAAAAGLNEAGYRAALERIRRQRRRFLSRVQ